MIDKKFIAKILTSIKYARLANHRRMIVVVSNDPMTALKIGINILKIFTESLGRNLNILYTYHPMYDKARERRDYFKKFIPKGVSADFVPYPDTVKILGMTYDFAILDLFDEIRPNDLGRLIGIIKGGGLIVLLLPKAEKFLSTYTRFQANLVTIGYTIDQVRQLFKVRFLRKIMEHEGTIVYDADSRSFLKYNEREVVREWTKGSIEVPKKIRFPRKAYSLALTQDQVNVIKCMEKLYEKVEGEKIAIVVIADRGRGKSCAIGIGTAALSHRLRRAKGRVRILVTAPHISNVQSLFDLAKKTLEELDYSVESVVDEGFIRALKAKGITIEYYKPLEVLRRQGDIIVVDEAAGLQVPMLFGIYRRFNKLVFSSTIHGYEGSGRGFSVRFLSLLKRDKRTRVYEYEMEEPIRYAIDDPVERWLFDTLLLDAEPAELDEKDLEYIDKMEVEYHAPKLEEFFLEREKDVRQFIGIYVMAHYRNNPDDLGIMMDAPHHTIRYLSLPTGKIVTAIELAEEGGIPKDIAKKLALGAWIAGNIIPDRFVKHTRILEFSELKGWRIVRIATHPKVQGRGLGSKALEFIVEEGRRNGYDWVGAGFGVNYELLRFWIKNGFIPIHISPDRNPVSGEYSVIVVKPLTEKASKLIEIANREFRTRLLHSLHEPYHDLNPKVARLLLNSGNECIPEDVDAKFTPVQISKLLGYSWNLMTIENCFDSVLKIVRKYFADRSGNRPDLSEEEEVMLIVRVLQAKSWRVSCEQLRKSPPELMNTVRAIIRKLCIHYLNANEEMMMNYFVPLNSL